MRLKLFLLGIVFIGTIANGQTKEWTLQECIDYALENNLSVLQSQLNNQISENQVQIAKNQKLPDLSANIGNDLLFGRSNVPVTNSSDLSTSLRTDNFQRYSATLGVGSNITIYNGRTLNLNEKKAAIDFQSNVWATEDLKNDISLNIVNLYLTVLLNREVESVAKEQLKISGERCVKSR